MNADFGPLAAQTDPRLLEYFHVSEQVSDLVNTNRNDGRFIVVSRPGAGKSALFQWAEGNAKSLRARPLRGAGTRILPGDDELNIDDYRTLCFSELGVATAFWAGKELRGHLGEGTKSLLTSFKRSGRFKKFKEAFGRFEGASALGFGFSLTSAERSDYMTLVRQPEYQQSLSELLAAIGKDVNPTLVLDDPEYTVARGLSEISEANAQRLGGLFSALAKLDALGIGVLVFVREHVYRSVVDHYQDASHFADRAQGLGWSEEGLLDVIRLRLDKRVGSPWAEAFEVDETRLVEIAFKYLVNGPRDLLFICNTAGAEGTPITEKKLVRAVDLLAADRWRETNKQFGALYPDFERFAGSVIRALRQPGTDNVFSPEHLLEAITHGLEAPGSDLHDLRKEHGWVDALAFEPQTAVDLLYAAGCLGFVRDGERVYPWAGRFVGSFRLADEYFLSPAFAERTQ